jgi:hypothetical protein
VKLIILGHSGAVPDQTIKRIDHYEVHGSSIHFACWMLSNSKTVISWRNSTSCFVWARLDSEQNISRTNWILMFVTVY